jgi:hypothetical protein
MSPNCSDVEFRPRTVLSRPGLGLRFTDDAAFTGIQSFYGQDRVRRLMALEGRGKVSVETPEGTFSQVEHKYSGVRQQLKAKFAFNRLWMCFSGATSTSASGMPLVRPFDFPTFYDPVPGTTLPYMVGPVVRSAPFSVNFAASDGAAGLITAGTHYFFYTFEDKYGQITQQSPVASWTAAGSKTVNFINIFPDQNSGTRQTTVRRRLWMSPAYVTGAGVAGFFNIGALVLDDNTTTSLGPLSFTDATLQNGTIWATSNLTLCPPPPAIGVTRFADRLVFWGVYPGIEPRLAQRVDGSGSDIVLLGRPSVNLSADYAGWTTDSGGGLGANAQVGLFDALGTRDGSYASTFNASTVHKDYPNLLTSSFQDPQYWLKPATRYGFLVRADGGAAGATLTITMKGQTSGTTLATAALTLPAAISPLAHRWAIYEVDGINDVPANEATIRFIVQTSGALAIDWIRPYLQANKFDGSTAWIGDNLIPTQFDLVKSPLPVAPGDWQETRVCFEQTGNLYFVKEHSTWVTSDNGSDPNTWNVDNVSFEMGTPSVHGVGIGPEFAIVAGREGVYRFDSGGIMKISQEIETTWKGIDWTQGHLLWVTVDATLKVISIGVPLKTGPAGVCNIRLKCDYTEGWNDGSLSPSESYAEGGYETQNRKWTFDNVATLCGEMAEKDDGSKNLLLGGTSSPAANNLTDTSLSSFTQTGTRSPTVATLQAQPMGPYTGTSAGTQFGVKWTYSFSSGTARAKAVDAISMAAGAFFVASFWAQSPTVGVNVPATIRDPFGLVDVPITITPAWQRFVAVFGPAPANGVFETLDIDFGTLSAPIAVILFGPELQSGQFDKGWPGQNYTTGANITAAGQAPGFLSEPTVHAVGSDPPWKTQDWNAIITSTYEFAPLAPTKFGRNIYDRFIARIRGFGNLAAYYVMPDNSVTPLNGPVGPLPALTTAPVNDVEMGGTQQGTFVGIRLQLSNLKGWFALKRVALFTKPSEASRFRGK